MVTIAVEPPAPVTVAGLKLMEAGWPCGVTVICDWTFVPFQPAVMVASVFAATVFVGTATATDVSPAAMFAIAGGMAADELLVRLIAAPPAGAWPFNVMSALP